MGLTAREELARRAGSQVGAGVCPSSESVMDAEMSPK